MEHETTEDIEVTDEMLRAGTATFTVQTADAEKIAIDAYLDNGSGEESDPAKSHTVAIDNTPVVPPQPPTPPAPPVEQPQPPAPTVEQPQPPTPKPEETANTPTPKPVHQKGDSVSEPALPELVYQNGTGISEPAKPEMPAEIKKGDSVSESTLPELAYQNSKGISESEKPEIVIERKKGDGVSEPEKLAIAINQRNGSGITKPALPEQPFNQKGSSVTESEKPAVIIAQQKGNSVSEPALPELLVNQKGTGVTEAEKPAVPVVQQKGTGVTADEKPAVTVQQKGASLTEPEKPTLEIGATPSETDNSSAETQRPSENTVYTQRLNISYALEEMALLSGSANAAVLGSTDAVTQTVAARQQQPVIENERNVWAKTTDNRRKDRSRFGYQAHQNAVVIGGDASGSNYRIGLAAAYSQDDADTAFAQQLRSQSWHGLLYGDYAAGKAKIDFLAGGFYGKTDSECRSLADNGKAEAGYSFHGAQAGLGISFPTGSSFTPFVRADYTKLWMRSYRERGETAQLLNVNPDNAQSLIARAGVKWTLPLAEAVKLESHLAAGAELLDNQFGGHANLTGQPDIGFAYRSEKTGRALGSAGLRINVKPTENLNLFSVYEAQLRKRYLSQQAQIGVEYRF